MSSNNNIKRKEVKIDVVEKLNDNLPQTNHSFPHQQSTIRKKAGFSIDNNISILGSKPISPINLINYTKYNLLANSQSKMCSNHYVRDLKQAALAQDYNRFFSVLGEYYALDCNTAMEAKHYAQAFYIAEHYGSNDIKKHIYGIISEILQNRLKKDLSILAEMLCYRKEFHIVYPQLIALLQVHITEEIKQANCQRVERIFSNEIPVYLLKKNFTYLVEIPCRYAKKICELIPNNNEAKKLYLFIASLKADFYSN